MKRAFFALFISALCCISASAQLSVNTAYRIKNTSGNYLTCNGSSSTPTASASTASGAQIWYLIDAGAEQQYYFKNFQSNSYLTSNGGNAWSMSADTSNAKSILTVAQDSDAGNYYVYNQSSGTGQAMHQQGGTGKIVGWTYEADNSRWIFEEVDQSTIDILQEIQTACANKDAYQTALNSLFSDAACTSLSLSGNLSDNASYLALPPTLRSMVSKIQSGNWEETFSIDGKDITWHSDYASKYRVQLYEPYNEPEAAASALRINAHTNLNNPTGIFANAYDVLYVMVEGTIKDGASLYLASYTGHARLGGYSEGTQLTEGLNIIPIYNDNSNFCINYVVHTFDTANGTGSKAKKHPLSNYEPLKIHIEGGHINGYYNKVGDSLYSPDSNETWEYIESRATQKTVTILGKYMTLQFPLNDADTEGNKGTAYYFNDQVDIEPVIDEWDKIMLWERLLMGLNDEQTLNDAAITSPYSGKPIYQYSGNDADDFACDYGDYYNLHGLAFGVGGTNYMYGGWDHSGYHYNTMSSILTELPTGAGVHWGPAHEIGHQHQGPLNMRGLTEVTNNLFANVVLWCFGESTSRVNGTDGALASVLGNFNQDGSDFFSMNIWAQTHMYYKLFLYYHVLGHNTKFYPRLFEMLRRDPMVIGYDQDGSECLLHFYKKCCEASGHDLTEFFRAHGFFNVMNDRLVGDYYDAVYNMTQAQINQAIDEVKALNYEENLAVLFINDATGQEILSHKGDVLQLYDSQKTADVGSYASFATATQSDYTYSISGSTVTMEGTGGVGFAIKNAQGQIIAFSVDKTFTVSPECAALIAAGEVHLSVINSDNSETTPLNVMDSDNVDSKYAVLGNLIKQTNEIVTLSDPTATKVGFYRADAIANLIAAFSDAKEVYDAKTTASYSAVYDALQKEYAEVLLNRHACIDILPGNAYLLVNKAYPDRAMSVSDSQTMIGETTNEASDAQKWYFVASDTEDSYFLLNKNSSTYPGNVSTGSVLSADKTSTDQAKAYKLVNKGSGVFALVGATGLHCSSSQSYNIVGWSADADASQWFITAVELNADSEAANQLQIMIDQTETLMAKMASVQSKAETLALTTVSGQAGFLSTNACHNTLNNASDGQGLDGLLDGDDTSTFFHSDYKNKVTETHYLQVDLGEENDLDFFTFHYSTRDNGNNCPTAIEVSASIDGSSFTPLATFTDGLPTGSAQSWKSPLIAADGYRYLRFSVTETEKSQIYFVMSSFGITDMTPAVNSITETYAAQGLTADFLYNAYSNILKAKITLDDDEASAQQINEHYTALEQCHAQLLSIFNAVETAELSDEKAKLQDLIDQTNALIAITGTVTETPATETEITALQASDPQGDYYVWSNATDPSEGSVAQLIDGDTGTSSYFHSNYRGADSDDTLDHHITINLGQNNPLKAFKFKYSNRTDAVTNFPAEIVVYGSNDGSDFHELITLNDMETTPTTVYTSPIIKADEAYSYLRFMVTKNNSGNTAGGHPYFHMAEFYLTAVSDASYSVTLSLQSGNATEQQLLDAYIEANEAQSAIKYVTAKALIQEAYQELNAAYLTLKEAQAFDKSELTALISEVQTLLDSCLDSWLNAVDKDYYNSEIAAAQTACNDKTITTEEYQAVLNELSAVKARLEQDAAFGPLPVKLTTDLANPAYHFFVINRYDGSVLRKGGITTDSRWPQDHKIRVIARAVPADEQLWYFVKGETAPNVYIYNKAVAQDSVMSVISGDLAEGAGKVGFYNADGSTNALVCDQWFISNENSAEGFYNVRAAANSDFYFSNYGGETANMGFYNEKTNTDPGSNFKFEPKSEAWMTLYDLFRNDLKITLTAPDYIFPADQISNETNGCYTQALATAYENAYYEAHQLILSSQASDEDLLSAYTSLKNANDALVPNGGEPSGIEEVTMDSLNQAVIYDLQGRRITHPRRLGIYIINGVKTLLK